MKLELKLPKRGWITHDIDGLRHWEKKPIFKKAENCWLWKEYEDCSVRSWDVKCSIIKFVLMTGKIPYRIYWRRWKIMPDGSLKHMPEGPI